MRTFVLFMVLSLGFLALSVRAMRTRTIREQGALLWIGVSVVMVFLSATLPLHLLNRVASLVGVDYPPDLLLLCAVLFLFVLVFHLTTKVDRLTARQTVLAQELGLMTVLSPGRPRGTSHEDPELATAPVGTTPGT